MRLIHIFGAKLAGLIEGKMLIKKMIAVDDVCEYGHTDATMMQGDQRKLSPSFHFIEARSLLFLPCSVPQAGWTAAVRSLLSPPPVSQEEG